MSHTHSPTRHGPTITSHDGKPKRSLHGLLSIVIPCHNEESVIETTHRRLLDVLPQAGMEFEIVYVDDGSYDGTLERLERIAAGDCRARVVELARNFGQQAAMSAGLSQARGDAIVLIDADLQDPPEVIPEMVRLWREGVDVAYGRRRSREGETRFKLITAGLFHRLMARMVPHPIPIDTGDFKLLDRAVVDAVCALPEKRRYLRSLVAWTGFHHEPVWYDRQARTAGVTKYSVGKLVALAADALVISSDVPVRLTWLAAGTLAAVGIVAGTLAAFSATNSDHAATAGISLAAVVTVVALAAAIQTAAVAVVGEYVARTYREAQGRPTWIVKRTIQSRAQPHVSDSRAA